MDKVWRIVVWSLTVMYRGVHPEVDHCFEPFPAGSSEAILGAQRTPLAGDFFCVLWGVKGDLDWYGKELHLRKHTQNAFCDFCPCDKGGPVGMQPSNFGTSCTWKGMLRTPSQWRGEFPDMHQLFKSFSFMSCWNIEADELHILHIGFSRIRAHGRGCRSECRHHVELDLRLVLDECLHCRVHEHGAEVLREPLKSQKIISEAQGVWCASEIAGSSTAAIVESVSSSQRCFRPKGFGVLGKVFEHAGHHRRPCQ